MGQEPSNGPDEGYDSEIAPDAIAIVGMACRLPGADDIHAFWSNMLSGTVSISQFSDDELEDSFTPEERASEGFVKARSVLENIDMFDASFFGMYPREAALTDPQHRLFLECCWNSLEDAGYDVSRYDGAVGVFAGCSLNTYFMRNVCGDRAGIEYFTDNNQVGAYSEAVGNMPDYLASRVSYKLNLRGPAISMASACSTTALAISQAVQSLQLYQSDMALAGGVSIALPQRRGALTQDGGLACRDGVCRPFDANASGTIFGSGAGAVVLKRLEDAIEDGDHVYGVILGVGVNNDGGEKISFTAPSASGQAEAITAAHASGGIDPRTVGYVECHGTATPLGDPIEFSGLMRAFNPDPDDRHLTALGSLKANIGHVDAAAGVTSLIKTALSLHHEEIAPLTHFTTPNPAINLDASPFYIPTEITAWPATGPARRAGVSSFGVGGTNVHIALEEAPRSLKSHEAARDEDNVHTLPLSARTDTALAAMKANLADHLEAHPNQALADVAFTLQEGRKAFAQRTAVAGRDRATLIAKLRGQAGPIPQGTTKDDDAAPAIFMFSGQGAQHPKMGLDLYNAEPLYKQIFDDGAAILTPLIGEDLRDLLYGPGSDAPNASDTLRATRITQPALFLVEYATARLWMERGVEPTAMIGHSLGEFVAACLADVMSFEDALTLIAARGRLMQARPEGSMLSVRLGEAELTPMLPAALDLAGVNSPTLCVVSGEDAAIDVFAKELADKDIAHTRLHTSHAFHSAMMAPAVEALAAEIAKVSLSAPSRRFISCVTGDWITDAEATDPNYWARHLRAGVRFADGVAVAAAGTKPVLIEMGPGRTLATFAGQSLDRADVAAIVSSLPDHNREHADDVVFAEAAAKLWAVGAIADWAPLRAAEGRRVSLPTYAFDRQSCWVDEPAKVAPIAEHAAAPAPLALVPQVSAIAPNLPIAASLAPTMDIAPPAPATDTVMTASPDRKATLSAKIAELLEDLSGEAITAEDYEATFIELGFDSLFLGQVAQKIQNIFSVTITFRQLLGDVPTVAALSEFLDEALPTDAFAPEAAPAPAATAAPVAPAAPLAVAPAMPGAPISAAPMTGDVASLFQAQAAAMQQLFDRQLQALQGGVAPAAAAPAAAVTPAPVAAIAAPAPAAPAPAPKTATTSDDADGAAPSRFRQFKKGAPSASDAITNAQRAFIADFVTAYNTRTAGSKARTAKYRNVLADPRSASAFRTEWKDAVYPIVCDRAKGSKLWDIDGNEYVDLVNGYGAIYFGHSPDFVIEAVEKQLHTGFPIGPQSPLAGKVAARVAKFLDHERVTFCNTGSEAVMAAMRVARTVSGRERVVVFSDDYHGQFDEVLVKGGRKSAAPRALPIAPGIPPSSVSNMTVLQYGAPESLQWIRDNASDIAAVMVETVQSRHPEHRPIEFLRELRTITTDGGIAYVFDEVVTGLRLHPRGAQGLFGIEADMATYGKIFGGGMPIGLLAGKAKYMDALDGGAWEFGDDSVPEVAPTFFAGTFVRHPLVLAAADAVMQHVEEQGETMQTDLAERTSALVKRINADLERRGVASRATTFSCWFVLDLGGEDPLASLFYPYVRHLGVHVQEGFACFLTTTHTDENSDRIAKAFSDALDALQSVGILKPQTGAKAIEAPAAAAPTLTAPAIEALTEAPLTEPQKEVWMAAQMSDGASCGFNESLSLRLEGDLNAGALRAAFNDVIARHDALRATFERTGAKMNIAPELVLETPLTDLSGEANPDAAFARFLEGDARTPFDLTNGPLVRTFLVRLSPTTHVLIVTAHHIICDGWSLNIVVEELAAGYAARLEGHAANLPAPLPFTRYAVDQDAGNDGAAAIEDYWLKLHADPAPLPELPTDRPRPAQKSYRGATYSATIDADLYRAVKKAGGRQGSTLFSTLFATLQVMIGRLSNQNDIVLAVPTAGQSLIGEQILVGHCVNFLPLRAPFDPETPFSDHLKAVQSHTLDAFDRQDFTFGTLVRKLNLKRDLNRLPLTEVQFNLERMSDGAAFPGLATQLSPNPKAFTNFDIFFNVTESKDGLRIDCDYNTDVFDEATMARWVDHYRTLLAGIVEDATRPIKDMPLLSDADRTWLLHDLNATTFDYPRDTFLHDLIARQATRTPDKTAVAFDGVETTYAALESAANRLARRIRVAAPQAGSRVAVATDRSTDMLIALLGVMKAGRTYVPLDPTQPADRLKLVLDTANVSAFICDSDEMAAIAPATAALVRLDTEADAIAAENDSPLEPASSDTTDAAYVIFTSGSTGTPKGVEVSHRALVNFLWSMARTPGFTTDDTVMAVTTISFDIAGLELYLPLIVGGTTVICTRDEVRDGFALVKRIQDANATVIQATPSLWRILIEAGLKSARPLKLLCGGEALPRDLANQLADLGELWNVYGPTETTIWSSTGRIEAGDGPVTIGAPIGNTQLYIVDAGDGIAPVGVVGELLIGGDGLANGYFDRPDLTDQAFVTLELEPGKPQRLYRTGDVGKRLASGELQLLGRRDHQVKVRGFRIELEEIETALRNQVGIADAATAVHMGPDGTGRLVGYVVASDGADIGTPALAESLGASLPDYMVPTLWVKLDTLPLTQNGKLDRKALPEPGENALEEDREVTPPRTDWEEQIAAIWRDILHINTVGVHDNLFTLGADSLHVFRIAARMIEQGIGFEAKHLLQHPTIAELSSANDAGLGNDGKPSGPSLSDFRGGARRRSTGS